MKRNIKPFVVLLVLFGMSLMAVSYFGKGLDLHNDMETTIDMILALIFLLVGYHVYMMSNDIYRYSIIADDFLIHKINCGKNKLVHKIKLTDIKSIEMMKSKKEFPKNFRNNFSENITKPGYSCEYHIAGKNKVFYFDPSVGMVSKLNNVEGLHN
ncbi:MAG: hypothetical protein WBI17_07830 [Clostridiaceae bacterium]